MTAMVFLLPLAIVLGATFAGLFVYAARRGQFDDLDEQARKILDE